MIRYMIEEDYYLVKELWNSIKGFRIRHIDDSKEGIIRLLKRNPKMSIVAEEKGKIIGTVLCGHDGRTGMIYHVCVDEKYRNNGIGKSMVYKAIEAFKREKINTISLIAFTNNVTGNLFWSNMEFIKKQDINYYNINLNSLNTIKINL